MKLLPLHWNFAGKVQSCLVNHVLLMIKLLGCFFTKSVQWVAHIGVTFLFNMSFFG